MTQLGLGLDLSTKRTRKREFLDEMRRVVPWSRLIALIEPHYPKAGRRGRPPMLLGTMLRIHFMQQWYALSDPGMEDALYEIESMRRFARLDLGDDALPDETTILKFRRLLETHGLAGKLLEAVNAHLGHRGLLLRQGTIVDGQHLGGVRRGELARHAVDILTGDHDRQRTRGRAGDLGKLLRPRDGLPARAIELAVLLFGNDQNHRTRASSRSRLINSFAASAGEPPIIVVCLAFCGA